MIVKSTEWAIKSQSSLPSHLFLFLTPEAGLKNVHVCTPNKWPILFLCSLSWQNHDRDNARTFGSLSEGAAHRDWKGKAVKVTPAVVVREWVRQLVLKVTFRKKKKGKWVLMFSLCSFPFVSGPRPRRWNGATMGLHFSVKPSWTLHCRQCQSCASWVSANPVKISHHTEREYQEASSSL